MTLQSVRSTASRHCGMVLPPLGNLILGEWRGGPERVAVLDKFSGDEVAEIAGASKQIVMDAVAAAIRAHGDGAPPPLERAAILHRVAALVENHRSSFIELMVAEAGFTPSDAGGEVDRARVTLRLAAEEAPRLAGEVVAFAGSPGQHDRFGFTIRVPIGVVCAITPFNSPLNTVLHKVAPAFAAGNPVILKPSTFTPLTAALLCQLFLDAGIPPGFLALVQGSDNCGRWLLEEPRIAFYTFTGSTRVGRIIQAGAGLRRTQLELGSIASTLVCADADLDVAIPKIARAAFRKAGQVCTSIQRLYVEEAVAEEVTQRLAAEAVGLRAGDPKDPSISIGPMISIAAAERAHSAIQEALGRQARLVCGGDRDGQVLQPTMLTKVNDDMSVVKEEIFAPVVSILPFARLQDAVTHANNTPYGLAAGLFTRDIDRALKAANSLRFGGIHINETSSSRADVMPFGGVKDSGFGHEGPKYAMLEMTEQRLVTIQR